MTGLQQVHLRINDPTGRPTPVRLRITDSDGAHHVPFGRLARFAEAPGVDVGVNVRLGDEVWSMIDGSCEIALPPGRLRIQADKGPEWTPLDVQTTLQPGKMSLRLEIHRWIDLAADGWFSGDVCSYELPPHAALLEAMASGLTVADLLVRERPGIAPAISNIAAFSGQRPALEQPGHMVVVNSANQSPHGRLLLLNCHRTVFPLSFSAEERWSLIDWCDQCHRKNGLVVADDWLLRLADGPVPELLDPDFLKRVDAIRFHPDVPLTPWLDLVERGRMIPLVAGSGKESNRELLGSWRTYAFVDRSRGDGKPDASARERLANSSGLEGAFGGESVAAASLADASGFQLTYADWIAALRSGRTFVTNGPLLRPTATGVEARWRRPLERLEFLGGASSTGPADVLHVAGRGVARCVASDGAMAIGTFNRS